ncbi:DUF6499 domain-containing protein [Sphingomonas sp.]|uniref:transcriptional regulator domain-containing protein n=1 Tax=Sphingomonas sp. TaxID=28214 RepID=UPI00345BF8EF
MLRTRSRPGDGASTPGQYAGARKNLARRIRVVRTGMTADRQERLDPQWRDGGQYTRLRGIDRAGLMWEWLRRDPGYIAWYARASDATRGAAPAGPAADPVQWGLHFRRGPGTRRTRSQDHLARRPRPGDAARHRRALGPVRPRQHQDAAPRSLVGDRNRRRRARARRALGWVAPHPH